MEHWIIPKNVRPCPTAKIPKMGFDTLDLNALAHLIIIRSRFYLPQASINLPFVGGTMLIIVFKHPLCHELHLAKIKLAKV